MEHIDQNIDIDLIDPVINVAYCNQYENASRRIICHVLKEGKAYNIPSNIDVHLRIHKANHYNLYEKVSNIGEINGNKIIIPLMPEMTKSHGRHECIFEFVDTTEKKLLYSTKFYIRVAKSPIQNENIQDSHEYTALVDFMNTKGKANGMASLDENGKVPLEELYEATTLDKGITQLTDSILSNSITTAATPNSVKITYDAVTAEKERATAAENNLDLNKADIASPTLTGTPKAPTASAGNNTTQIATTSFVQTAVSNHNSSSTAHTDIRDLISELTTRLNALADSDDTTLDQLSEIVAYIKSNKTLIDNITTSKVNITDIIDDLTSTAANKPLSAKQGKNLKDLLDELTSIVADSSGSCTGNAATATKLETPRTIDGVSFDGSAAISHYGTCSTSGSTAAKTVSLTGFSLVTGARISVYFSNTNTASSPTLNVNGTGAKTIRYGNNSLTSTSAASLRSGRVYDFVYDGTYWRIIEDPAMYTISSDISNLAANVLPVISKRINSKTGSVNIASMVDTTRDCMYLVSARCHIAVQTGIAIWFVTAINGISEYSTCNPLIQVEYLGAPTLTVSGNTFTFGFYDANGGDVSIIRLNP